MTITTLSTSVQQCINNFAAALIRNKTLILQCIGFTFLWGLIAHGFMFANNNLSHDSLLQLVEGSYTTSGKVGLGRVFVPAYEYIVRGVITIPWMIGIISLLYIGVASFFVAKIFSLRSTPSLILLTGILSVNVTVTALTATYISDLDADMFAMLASVVAVFCWAKYKKGFFLGAIPLAISLGLYQSYISTTITLVIFFLIISLLQGQSYKEVIINGLKAVAMILCAGLLYICAMKVVFAVYDVALSSGDYNSLDAGLTMSWKTMIKVAFSTYTDTLHKIFYVPSIYRMGITRRVHILLVAIPLLIIFLQMFSKKLNIWNKLLIVALVALLPWAMNISQVLAANISHTLMYYALWLIYLFVILIVKWNSNNAILTKWNFDYWCKLLSGCLILLVLIGNVRLANTAYFVKDMENKAALSLATKISADIEHHADYVVGETKVAFVGVPYHLLNDFPAAWRSRMLVGMHAHGYLTEGRCSPYFNYYLMSSSNRISRQEMKDLAQLDAVQAMPLYPEEGSIQMIDDILVVKLGEGEVQP